MNLQDFNTPQEIIACKNPIKSNWIVAVDIGFSSVKGMSPNKRFCFPSYVKKMDNNLMSVDEDDMSPSYALHTHIRQEPSCRFL